MSGIYIPGTEMPKSCYHCKFSLDGTCIVMDRKNKETTNSCPLVPVPEHGRLLKVLKTERECVSRDCDRNCGECDLSLERDEVVGVYDALIAMFDPAKDGEG